MECGWGWQVPVEWAAPQREPAVAPSVQVELVRRASDEMVEAAEAQCRHSADPTRPLGPL